MHLIPNIKPVPLISSKISGYLSINPRSPWVISPDFFVTELRNSGVFTISSTLIPTEQANGFPPYVEPCVPAVIPLAADVLARTAPRGNPPPMPLATIAISGSIPDHSYANSLPVRPIPHWTSSTTNNISCLSHKSRKPFKHWSGKRRIPPSPCMGSIRIAAVFSLIAASMAS